MRDLVSLSWSHEILKRLIDSKLDLSLLRLPCSPIEELQEISGIDLDANAIFVRLIEVFTDTSAIFEHKSTILHDFNASIRKDRATLRTIIHDSQLRVVTLATNSDRRVDWVVIGGGKFVGLKGEIWSLV